MLRRPRDAAVSKHEATGGAFILRDACFASPQDEELAT
jgi:hypothetical protein